MKKIVIAMVLVLALTVSTFAGVFADVPSNHWAYEAVNELVAAGLIQGYPDGTFKGQNELTRYEVATMLARLLADIEDARAELVDQVDFMITDAVLAAESGLSEAEAEDVQAILEAVIAKNAPADVEYVQPDSLSVGQAGEVALMIANLAAEFNTELLALGVRIDGLEDRVADLEEGNAVSFNGEYKVEFKDYSGSGIAFVNDDGDVGYYESPFDFDLGEDLDYELGRNFKHLVDLNVNVTTGPLVADLNLKASEDKFGEDDGDEGFAIDSLEGTITGRDFVATIKEEQQVGMRPYLFGGQGDWDGEEVDGVVVETANGKYFLDGNPYTQYDGAKADAYAFAGSNEIDFLGGFNLVYGYEKLYGNLLDAKDNDVYENNGLVGIYKTFEVGNFDVTPEFAVSDREFEGTYLAVNAEGNLGIVDATAKFETISADFRPIAGLYSGGADDPEDNSTFISVAGEVTEENGIEFVGFNIFGDAAYRSFTSVDDATSSLFNLNAKNSYGKLDVTGKLEYQDTTQVFDDVDEAITNDAGDTVDLYEEEEDKFDKSVELGYAISDSLTAGALYTLNKDNDLSEHDYTLDYAKGIVTAGIKLDIDTDHPDQNDETHLYAGLNADKAESYDLLALAVTPYAEYKTWTEMEATNILAGVEASKALNQYANLKAGYEWFDVENMGDIDEIDEDEYDTGLLQTTFVGVSYDITEDVTANADYKNIDFNADTLEDYEADLISAGVTVAF